MTFPEYFQMKFMSFSSLYHLLKPLLKMEKRISRLWNRTASGDWTLAYDLPFVAGVSVYELMDAAVIAKTTAYESTRRVELAIVNCKDLPLDWPAEDELDYVADKFRERNRPSIRSRCVGVVDRLFARTKRVFLEFHPD
ncbi:unnamed protein product [Choristocarpus tenellus]